VIDWEVARSLTGGDEDLLREVSEMFPEESRRTLADIRSAIETGDARRLTRGAHLLKSTAGLFGASALVEAAFEMERLGDDAQLGSAGLRLEALEAATTRVCAALAKPGRA
jgi:HPt (histidine-containing phosphotransfer) domain-containing protein